MSHPVCQQPTANLTQRQGPCPGKTVSLPMPIVRIGRDEVNDLIVGQPEVSRHHCRLTWDGSRYVIQDLGSRNGTYVNGMRVRTPKVVHEGDLIGVGQSLLLAFSGHPSAALSSMGTAPAGPALSGSMLQAVSRLDPPPTMAFIPPDLSGSPVPAELGRRLLTPATMLGGLAASLAAVVATGFNSIRASYQAEPIPN